MTKKEFHVTDGNVFEDLGLKDFEELTARSDLLSEVNRLILNSKLKQKEIAKILGITPPKVSMLTTGKLSAFSTDTLMKYLTLLGCSIEIKVNSKSSFTRNTRKGRMTVRRNNPRPRSRRKPKIFS
ncbi:MAG TPA: helix-turn-helix transcriptional regulator [Chlamydiales bacterium]|nr:helix-turn-helix transcriptional regulator [Chlamydiales bacterium]